MKKIYMVLILALMAFSPLGLLNNTVQTLPFAQNWTTTTLITTNDDWSGVPGIVGYRGDDITTTTGVDPQTLVGEGTITIDVIANQTAPNTNTSGGVTEFEITDPVIALQGSGTADAPNIVLFLNTTSLQNITVAYNLRDIDGSTDNAVQPVALQYRVGNSGNFTNVPAGFVADASSGPSLATLITPVSAVLPSACNNQAEVQVRVITANAAGNDEWIGIDDINVTGSPLSGNSSSSDIIANSSFSTPSNINYTAYQATDITDVNSLEVAQFTIRDGGGAADGDALGTILTNFVMGLSNSANIRRVALYDGTTELAEVAGGATANFSGLTVAAPDDGTKTFSVRVTFNSTVTDNHQFVFTVTSATADVAGSNFAAANAGGAVSSSTGDENRIEVTADRLAFVQNTTSPTGVSTAMAPAPTVSANDINNNRDLDFTGFIEITSTGTLLGTPVSSQAVAGLSTFSGAIIHTVAGTGFQLTAAFTGLTSATSNLFDIQTASSASDYFRTVGSGNWGTATTWESSADNAIWIPATLAPTDAANTITIRNGHTVTVAAAANADQVTIEAGATVNLNADFALADGTDANDLVVNGIVINTNGNHSIAGAIQFNAGSLYQHNRNGGSLPLATWDAASTTEVTGITNATAFTGGINQVFGNFIWNSAGQTSSLNLVGALASVNGNFKVQNSGAGQLRLTGSAVLNLTVAGDFIIEDNIDIDNNATGTSNINIGGNFAHTSGNLLSSSDVVAITMTGSGKTFTQSGGVFTATNFDWGISNGADLTLLNTLTIAASRVLTLGGNILLGSNNLIVDGLISGGSLAGHIVTNNTGALKINNVGATDVIFPVGPSTTLYHPATINNSGTVDNFSVNVASAAPPCADPAYSANSTWNITEEATGGSNCALTLDFTGASTGASFAAGLAKVVDCGGSAPYYNNGSVTGTIATGSGFTSFSPFGATNDLVILPVSYVNFSGYKSGAVNKLTWTTASEQNSRGFDVQRSTDGINYVTIGFVNTQAVNGTSSDNLTYVFTDNYPAGAKQYYRLRQADISGGSKYSTVIVIKGEKANTLTIDGLYPNPATSQLNVAVSSPVRTPVTLQVLDMTGQVVARQVATVAEGSNALPVDVSSLAGGSYTLRVTGANRETVNVKFVKY